jgi:transcriptional regulator with XRE-family HTH domain
MSLRQLGVRLEISAQSVKEIEEREADGSITLRSLRQAANALDLDLVHVLVPRESSLHAIIEKRAGQVARSIVLRTSKVQGTRGAGDFARAYRVVASFENR